LSSTSSTSAGTVTNEGEAFPSDPRRLRYVDLAAPAAGTVVEVAPGVRWARIPLPIELDHINVWLVAAGGGCLIVDTGLGASIGKDAWEQIEREVFVTAPPRGVFVTHIHPDHIGLAAWLQERFDIPVWMSERTHEIARVMLCGGPSDDAAMASFFRSHGLNDVMQVAPLFKPERFARITSGMPVVEQRYNDGDVLQWGDRRWHVLETNGHAEGHLCLFEEQGRVLICGDQVLPTISSNISFTFRTRDPDPLGSYLQSLQRLRALPADTLALPSHGRPFYGLHQRIDDLSGHHAEQLASVLRICSEPRSGMELLPFMYRRELKGMHLFLALGEALAHAEHLVHAGKMVREHNDGLVKYRAST
jgi:glyoxylase-like metal-dependent hydrolase (beta-lactamase superfamily II)